MELPIYELRTKEESGKRWIWDQVRKKYLVLTPEELVRQNLVQFLILEMNIAPGLISLEKGIKYDRRSKRYDLMVFDREAKPRIVCECKAPNVPLDQSALTQLFMYNRKIGAPQLVLTNGKRVFFFQEEGDEFKQVEKLK